MRDKNPRIWFSEKFDLIYISMYYLGLIAEKTLS